MEDDNICRRGLATVHRAAAGETEAHGHVGHIVNDDAGALGRILRDAAQAGLEHVVAVEEAHLGRGLDPDLVARVAGDVVEGGDVEVEVLVVGELAEADAQRREVVARHVRRATHDRLGHVVDAVLLEAEAVRLAGAVEELLQVRAQEAGQLLEDFGRLVFGEGAHFWRGGEVEEVGREGWGRENDRARLADGVRVERGKLVLPPHAGSANENRKTGHRRRPAQNNQNIGKS